MPDKTFPALLETESRTRERRGRARVAEPGFNRRRDAPFLRSSPMTAVRARTRLRMRKREPVPVLESTLTDFANYRADNSAYLP